MKRTLKAILALAFAATVATAQDTNFAVRISCDFQQQAGAAELPDLTLLQGSAPMIQAAPMRMGRAVSADSLTTCQLVFGPSATSTYYVATNAYLATNRAYYIQLGTIGTNSVPAGSNSPAAWWYSILFYRNGGIYWSGSGRLYIERTTATGANGLVWQEWEAGAAKDDIARGWIADLSNVVDSIEVAGVDYGTNSTTAYRGDWGASVSNLAAQAAGWGDHALAGYLTAETDPVFSASDAYGITAAMLGNWDSAYGWGDHSTEGYLTSETDPVFAASDAAAVTAVKIGNWDTAYGWGDHAAAGYLTAETDPDFAAWLLTDPLAGYLTAETDAAALSAVAAVSGRVDVVEGWGDHAEAGYLPLSGYDGLVVLGTRTRGYAASTNLGDYSFAAGRGTSAGEYGFAAGWDTSAGEYGFAAGVDTSAGNYGFAAGDSTSALDFGFAAGAYTLAGDYGFAAGTGTSAGEYGFAAGVDTSAGNGGFAAGSAAKGADGSFVFADNSTGGTPFNRTDIPDSFSLRVAGGIYAEIGTNVFAVSNAVTMNGVELGAGGGGGGGIEEEVDPEFAAWLATGPLDDIVVDETDPSWTAVSGSVVYAASAGYTAAVEQAATAFGWGDHGEAGYLTAESDAAALSAVAAVSGRVDVVEGWGDHAEAGYLTGFTETDGVFTASAAYGITSGAISNWNAAALCFVPNAPGLAKLREIWDLQGTVSVAEVATNEVIVNVPIVNGEQAVMVKGARYYATATNYFLRPDGGTNAIYFDAASNMVIAVDGSPALTISPAGDVGVGTTPSPSFSLRTDASFYAGGGVRAGAGLASLNGKIYVNSQLTSYIELVGTNLMFTATNGVTGRIQMIYE